MLNTAHANGIEARQGFAIRPNPQLAPLGGTAVRLKILACGVCGTDLHILQQAADYMPLGHEICAQVLEIGEKVSRAAVGQRVVVEDNSMCGACGACKSGQVNLCRSGPNMAGQSGMARQIVLHENQLHDAGGIDPVAACLCEPLAVAIRCVEDLAPEPFMPLAIFGMGAIGLFCAAYARLRGAGPISLIARQQHSLRNQAAQETALAMGADQVVYTSQADWRERINALGQPMGAIVAAPLGLCAEALEMAGYGGKVLACGVTFGGDTHVSLDVNAMVFGKKALLTSLAEPGLHFPRALQLIRSGRIDVRRIVTHLLPLEQAGQLAQLYGSDAPAVKTVILPNGQDWADDIVANKQEG